MLAHIGVLTWFFLCLKFKLFNKTKVDPGDAIDDAGVFGFGDSTMGDVFGFGDSTMGDESSSVGFSFVGVAGPADPNPNKAAIPSKSLARLPSIAYTLAENNDCFKGASIRAGHKS